MKIGIIGAGIVARAIGKLAVRAGHEVMLSNSRGPRSLYSVPHATGCKVGSVAEAVAFGDIVVAAIPLYAFQELPAGMLVGKLVIDANNYYPERDGQIAVLDAHATTTSEMVAAHLVGARIVKAFNAIVMNDLETDGRPAGDAQRRALPLAGDDAADKTVVIGLYEAFGFDAVDAGPLAEGRRFERGTPAYCVPLGREALLQALAAA